MKAFIDGVIVELTEEEINDLQNIPAPTRVTDKERITALENAITDLAISLMGGTQ